MQKVLAGITVEEKVEIDQNACPIIEEAKEKENITILQAREEAQRSIKRTNEDFKKDVPIEALIVEEIVAADQNACRIIEEAKERGNRILLKAREEAKKLIEKTNEDFKKDLEFLERQLILEGREEADRVTIEKEKFIKKIKGHSSKCHEQVLQELRSKLFGGL